MTEPPRHLPRTADEQLRIAVERGLGGSDLGRTRDYRRVDPVSHPVAGGLAGGIVVVLHGDDGTVSRPAAAVVYWVGAATPANGAAYDFWYTATI